MQTVVRGSNFGSFALFRLTLPKHASLITTDFLAMIYKNEQSSFAYLCRGLTRLENDSFDMKVTHYSNDVILAQL